MKHEMTLETENKREKVWILTFRNAEGDREIAQAVTCREDDLLGAKEAVAGAIEERNGGLWLCVKVEPGLPESGGQVRMGETT